MRTHSHTCMHRMPWLCKSLSAYASSLNADVCKQRHNLFQEHILWWEHILSHTHIECHNFASLFPHMNRIIKCWCLRKDTHTFPSIHSQMKIFFLRRTCSFSRGRLLAIHICDTHMHTYVYCMHICIHTCIHVYQTDHPTQFGTCITYMKNISSFENTFSF